MGKFTVSASPHISGKQSTRMIMLDVLVALTPAAIASVIFFGLNAFFTIIVSCAAAFIAELLFNLILHKKWNSESVKKATVWDFSCLVTGLLVALNVPADAPLYIPMIGSVFAIVIVKMLFGGIGRNFANPAIAARVFLLLCFTSLMAANSIPNVKLIGADSISSETWLHSSNPSDVTQNLLSWFLGFKASAAMGETSILALLIGYVYLVVRKVIDFKWPLILIAATAAFSLLFDGVVNDKGIDILYNGLGHLMSGGLFLGAIFMATDYSSSPNTDRGKLIFCLGIAILTALIRAFGEGYPEGLSFAILIMNILVPLIDKYVVPKPFGYVKPQSKKKEAAR